METDNFYMLLRRSFPQKIAYLKKTVFLPFKYIIFLTFSPTRQQNDFSFDRNILIPLDLWSSFAFMRMRLRELLTLFISMTSWRLPFYLIPDKHSLSLHNEMTHRPEAPEWRWPKRCHGYRKSHDAGNRGCLFRPFRDCRL